VAAYRSAASMNALTAEGASVGMIPGEAYSLSKTLGARCEEMLKGAAEAVRARGVHVEVHGVAGDPADVICKVADDIDADLVVVGNKGMTGAKRFLLGSVPNKVAHHAACNVMIVRTT
jgi:nucleotide-binding universal stress UspA family protein